MQFAARLRLLRLASHRRRGSSVQLIKAFLNDPDERIARMATRELLRRRPPEYENLLLTRMPKAAESVRRVIGRSLGHIGFEQFWQRFDQLDRPTRQSAGRAMLKILPDAIVRLTRRLNNGPLDQRLKAMQMAQDLALVNNLREVLKALAAHANPKVRSKAISVLGSASDGSDDALLKKILQDGDARVRANAVEVIELTVRTSFIPILVEKARNGSSRERANSIKAMHKMRLGQAGDALAVMLKDERADHRISALWALRQMSFWKLLSEVGRLAKEDANMRVRRYALGILKGVAEMLRREKAKAG
jgi:HEAT repeat protein